MKIENKWYVVQVRAGFEEQACKLIERTEGVAELLHECFVPRYETMIHFRGQWVRRMRVLFPGYLIVVTANVAELKTVLYKVPAFTRLLGGCEDCEGIMPLTNGEVAWMSAFTEEGERVIGMSEGVIEGDKIVILKGPLMNHVGWIKSINRRKRLAYLEMQMFGRTIETKVGLGIIGRKP
ncbi:antiterminator LoaP [Adlercreutzia sp. ZJ154]|uniref:antiterminator LoaP n=1 Tax=Adlercreutzia sp. ZJ154 TaxID=2709790 RepID=UPI001F1501AF|nr:antiterminator LoaP [Adlercreutzia sp. ZJ154]